MLIIVIRISLIIIIIFIICLVFIIIVFIVGWQLEKRHVHWISEAAVGLIIGVAAGGIAYVTTHEFNVSSYADWMNFDPDFFFFALLMLLFSFAITGSKED